MPNYWLLADNSFIVFHPLTLKLTLNCPSGVTSDVFRGLRLLAVPPRCSASNGYFSLGSSSRVGRVQFHFQSEPVNISASDFSSLRLGQDITQDLSDIVSVKVHDPNVPSLPFSPIHPAVNDAVTMGSFLFCICILCVLVLAWYLDKRRQRVTTE